jgi:nucleotide-binding universal stress UspA family protein
MYTRILVPLDGSKIAEGVLPYARLLARELKIPIELMTVVDLVEISRQLGAERKHRDAFNPVVKQHALNAENYLRGVAKSFEDENVICAVENDVPAEAIVSKAGVDKGTLIAMATHGRSGLKRWLLGSIAEKVLRASNNPLLLVRANAEAVTDGKAALASVIVPLDGSELAESILPHAVELAKALDSKLRLMRSYDVTGMTLSYRDYSGFTALLAEWKNEAINYLDEKVNQVKNEGLSDVVSFTAEGEPAEEIIEAAKGAPNSLIAMCTHGRSGMNRWMLGSVTEKVVRHSGNPVLVVRAK